MAAPTFIQEFETADWSGTGTPKVTSSFNVVAGDLLVAFQVTADAGNKAGATPTGGSLTWTPAQTDATANHVWIGLWTALVDVDKSMTVSFSTAANPVPWGGDVLTFRGHGGVGASSKTTGSGAPTLNLTTLQANSAVVVANGDWAAIAGARTWRTNAGAFVETAAYPGDTTNYGAYGGYHADSGAIGTYAVGVTAPAGQTYSIVAVEIKGMMKRARQGPRQAVPRASSW